MKIGSQVLMFVAGAAIIGGLYAGIQANERDKEREFLREACLTVGEVAQDCDRLFPDVPRCTVEDCSDITGLVGYWRDKSDGRLYLQRSPWTIDAAQSAAESAG